MGPQRIRHDWATFTSLRYRTFNVYFRWALIGKTYKQFYFNSKKAGDFWGKLDRKEISDRKKEMSEENLTERRIFLTSDRKKEISKGKLTERRFLKKTSQKENFWGKLDGKEISDRKKEISEGNLTERRRFMTERRKFLRETWQILEGNLTERRRFLKEIRQKEGDFWHTEGAAFW